jgi:hypothetical protein
MPQAAKLRQNDANFDAAIARAIDACGGDLMATIRALVIANDFLAAHNAALAAEVEYVWQQVSPGFSRQAQRRAVPK